MNLAGSRAHDGLGQAFSDIRAGADAARGESVSERSHSGIEDGAPTMAFIEARLASRAGAAWVDVAKMPVR